jgi:hypothetical protein
MLNGQVNELELFRALGSHLRFQDWVQDQIAKQTDILVSNSDMPQIHRAQGAALFLRNMQALLDRVKQDTRR